MNTIILSKRVMSPRNIINNLVEGDINLVTKASEFFKAACRSTVGYKQIAAYLKITILVDKGMDEEVKAMSKKDIYKAEARAMKAALLERKNSNAKAIVAKPEPVVIKPEEKVMTEQISLEDEHQLDVAAQYTMNEWTEIGHVGLLSPGVVTYSDFAAELYKGFHLKPTRRLDEIEKVIKAVYRKFKDYVQDKEACRMLCIEAREAYLAMMDNNPPNWTWIPTEHYTRVWFSKAVDKCDPNSKKGTP